MALPSSPNDGQPQGQRRKLSDDGASSIPGLRYCPINALDDGCLMHIFSFLSPIPDRYNSALVCHRWRFLACHPRLWLRVERSIKDVSEPGVFPNIEAAVFAARPGDTIMIAAGGVHLTSNIQIKKPLCLYDGYPSISGVAKDSLFFGFEFLDKWSCEFSKHPIYNGMPDGLYMVFHWVFRKPHRHLLRIGGGDLPDETTLVCSRGYDSALELLSTCKISNLTVRTELGCCLLHRSGRLIIDSCVLQCESNPLDYLSCPIMSTATIPNLITPKKSLGDGVTVSHTRIEGGSKAVLTSGNLSLCRVRVIYARASILFWFDLEQGDS